MGQYHLIINLCRREFLDPNRFDNGAKLLEFAGEAYGVLAGLAILLAACNGRGGGDLFGAPDRQHPYGAPLDGHPIIGRWAGDAIAIVGDYHQPDDVPGHVLPGGFYHKVRRQEDGWVDLSEQTIATLQLDPWLARQRRQIAQQACRPAGTARRHRRTSHRTAGP